MVGLLVLGLSLVYLCLWAYFRRGQAERLAALWAQDRPPLPEATYVAQGLAQGAGSLRRRLIWAVYVVPITAVFVLIYILNA